MPVETFSEYAPLVRCPSPQANSTTSMPRAISPSASESTLPCSEVRISASSCLRAFSSSRNANSTVWRFAIEASRHCAHAAVAEATASSTSAVEARRTSRCTVPERGVVDGSRAGGRARPGGAVDPVVEDRGGGLLRLLECGGVGHGLPSSGLVGTCLSRVSRGPVRDTACPRGRGVYASTAVNASS